MLTVSRIVVTKGGKSFAWLRSALKPFLNLRLSGSGRRNRWRAHLMKVNISTFSSKRCNIQSRRKQSVWNPNVVLTIFISSCGVGTIVASSDDSDQSSNVALGPDIRAKLAKHRQLRIDENAIGSMTLHDVISVTPQLLPLRDSLTTSSPTMEVGYNLDCSMISVINAYKMAEVPSWLLSNDDSFAKINKFHERKLIQHEMVHSKEHMRFRVVLKPFSWLENIPLLSYLFEIELAAFEDWIIDYDCKRAECLISNQTLRWSFSVDEYVVIEAMDEDKKRLLDGQTTIYKSLYVNTFVPVPSLMFWNYKEYSDVYIDIIRRLALMRCGSTITDIGKDSGPNRNVSGTAPSPPRTR